MMLFKTVSGGDSLQAFGDDGGDSPGAPEFVPNMAFKYDDVITGRLIQPFDECVKGELSVKVMPPAGPPVFVSGRFADPFTDELLREKESVGEGFVPRILFQPYNPGGGHWVAVVIQILAPDRVEAVVMDSYDRSDRVDANLVLKLKRIYGGDVVTSSTAPRYLQPDTVCCGLAMKRNFEQWLGDGVETLRENVAVDRDQVKLWREEDNSFFSERPDLKFRVRGTDVSFGFYQSPEGISKVAFSADYLKRMSQFVSEEDVAILREIVGLMEALPRPLQQLFLAQFKVISDKARSNEKLEIPTVYRLVRAAFAAVDYVFHYPDADDPEHKPADTFKSLVVSVRQIASGCSLDGFRAQYALFQTRFFGRTFFDTDDGKNVMADSDFKVSFDVMQWVYKDCVYARDQRLTNCIIDSGLTDALLAFSHSLEEPRDEHFSFQYAVESILSSVVHDGVEELRAVFARHDGEAAFHRLMKQVSKHNKSSALRVAKSLWKLVSSEGFPIQDVYETWFTCDSMGDFSSLRDFLRDCDSDKRQEIITILMGDGVKDVHKHAFAVSDDVLWRVCAIYVRKERFVMKQRAIELLNREDIPFEKVSEILAAYGDNFGLAIMQLFDEEGLDLSSHQDVYLFLQRLDLRENSNSPYFVKWRSEVIVELRNGFRLDISASLEGAQRERFEAALGRLVGLVRQKVDGDGDLEISNGHKRSRQATFSPFEVTSEFEAAWNLAAHFKDDSFRHRARFLVVEQVVRYLVSDLDPNNLLNARVLFSYAQALAFHMPPDYQMLAVIRLEAIAQRAPALRSSGIQYPEAKHKSLFDAWAKIVATPSGLLKYQGMSQVFRHLWGEFCKQKKCSPENFNTSFTVNSVYDESCFEMEPGAALQLVVATDGSLDESSLAILSEFRDYVQFTLIQSGVLGNHVISSFLTPGDGFILKLPFDKSLFASLPVQENFLGPRMPVVDISELPGLFRNNGMACASVTHVGGFSPAEVLVESSPMPVDLKKMMYRGLLVDRIQAAQESSVAFVHRLQSVLSLLPTVADDDRYDLVRWLLSGAVRVAEHARRVIGSLFGANEPPAVVLVFNQVLEMALAFKEPVDGTEAIPLAKTLQVVVDFSEWLARLDLEGADQEEYDWSPIRAWLEKFKYPLEEDLDGELETLMSLLLIPEYDLETYLEEWEGDEEETLLSLSKLALLRCAALATTSSVLIVEYGSGFRSPGVRQSMMEGEEADGILAELAYITLQSSAVEAVILDQLDSVPEYGWDRALFGSVLYQYASFCLKFSYFDKAKMYFDLLIGLAEEGSSLHTLAQLGLAMVTYEVSMKLLDGAYDGEIEVDVDLSAGSGPVVLGLISVYRQLLLSRCFDAKDRIRLITTLLEFLPDSELAHRKQLLRWLVSAYAQRRPFDVDEDYLRAIKRLCEVCYQDAGDNVGEKEKALEMLGLVISHVTSNNVYRFLGDECIQLYKTWTKDDKDRPIKEVDATKLTDPMLVEHQAPSSSIPFIPAL